MYQPNLPDNADKALIEAEIASIYEAAREVLHDDYTRDEVIEYISIYRNRPLLVYYAPMPVAWKGLVTALLDSDLILLRHHMDIFVETMTFGHEAGHILANHLCMVPFTIEYVKNNPEVFIDYALQRKYGMYETDEDKIKEYVAEEIGKRLAKNILKSRIRADSFTQLLYGDNK